MTRLVSVMVVWSEPTEFREYIPAFEEWFKTSIEVGGVVKTKGVHACVFDVSVPDTFKLHKTKKELGEAMPNVSINILERFRSSWWRRYGWNIAISVAGGTIVFLVELMLASALGLRNLFG